MNTKFNFNNIKASLTQSSVKRELSMANAESVVLPFLHGLQITHRKFGSYIFMTEISEHVSQLTDRNFRVVSKEMLDQDSILKLGASVMHNKKFNLLFIMVAENKWPVINAAIDIAESSTKSFETQCHIVLSAAQVLSSQHIEFKKSLK